MAANGPAFYDDESIFATYTNHRKRPDNPNDTLEQPVILELIDSIGGKRVLDLGCGNAAFGRYLLDHGAATYLGVEGSHKMAEAAQQTLASSAGRVVQHTIEDWRYPSAAFDLVVARLVLHYIADLAPLCDRVFQTLAAGGQFVFSVEHPVITSCDRGWPAGTARQDWIVDTYFETGPRVTTWLGSTVQKYHRTVEEYFGTLCQSGFVVEHLREACPQREHFQDAHTYERRKRIPLFLILAGRKPA